MIYVPVSREDCLNINIYKNNTKFQIVEYSRLFLGSINTPFDAMLSAEHIQGIDEYDLSQIEDYTLLSLDNYGMFNFRDYAVSLLDFIGYYFGEDTDVYFRRCKSVQQVEQLFLDCIPILLFYHGRRFKVIDSRCGKVYGDVLRHYKIGYCYHMFECVVEDND